MIRVCLLCVVSLAVAGLSQAQRFQPNYDEKKVPKYKLPDPLTLANGKKVTDAKTWSTKRRPEILELFREHVYGRSPKRPKNVKYEVTSVDKKALGGKAIRKEVTIYLTGKKDGPKIHVLIYLPAKAKKPAPVFLTLNFYGNHSISKDPGITLSKSWMRNNKKYGVVNHKATEKSRGVSSRRWPIEDIIARGYGLVTVYYGDIDPDFDDGFKNGVHSVFKMKGADAWGSIATWAWGLSCVMDYLEQDNDIDHTKVIVMGHSRLGKTALWAGAADERFAIVISNNSGCGGAALSRRRFGETVWRINTSFPHWFCDNFNKYNKNEDKLPVDQHMLIALMAPRPVYVASAVKDKWADPKGEFLSAKHASPVYRLFGKKGLPVDEMPPVDRPVMGTIGYHVRSGGHDVKPYDWQRYMDFADIHFGRVMR